MHEKNLTKSCFAMFRVIFGCIKAEKAGKQPSAGADEDGFPILLYHASPPVRENDFNFSLFEANA